MTKHRLWFQNPIPHREDLEENTAGPWILQRLLLWPTPTDKPVFPLQESFAGAHRKAHVFPGCLCGSLTTRPRRRAATRPDGPAAPGALRLVRGPSRGPSGRQSYREAISRPCLTARPGPGPGPHGGLRIRGSRGCSRGRQPPHTETTPRDCPSPSDTCPPRPTVHYPPWARSHRDDRGHGGHDACDGRDDDLEDRPPRSHRKQPRLH